MLQLGALKFKSVVGCILSTTLFTHILREKSLAVYFVDLQFRRNRIFIFMIYNIKNL